MSGPSFEEIGVHPAQEAPLRALDPARQHRAAQQESAAAGAAGSPGSPASGCGSFEEARDLRRPAPRRSAPARRQGGSRRRSAARSRLWRADFWPAGRGARGRTRRRASCSFPVGCSPSDQYTRSRAASVARLTMTSDAKPAGRPRRRLVRARCSSAPARRRAPPVRSGPRSRGRSIRAAPRRSGAGAPTARARGRRPAIYESGAELASGGYVDGARAASGAIASTTDATGAPSGGTTVRSSSRRSIPLVARLSPGELEALGPTTLRHHQARRRTIRFPAARRARQRGRDVRRRGSPTGGRRSPGVTTPPGCAPGVWRFWFEDGRPSRELEFLGGVRERAAREWHPNGTAGRRRALRRRAGATGTGGSGTSAAS